MIFTSKNWKQNLREPLQRIWLKRYQSSYLATICARFQIFDKPLLIPQKNTQELEMCGLTIFREHCDGGKNGRRKLHPHI